MSGYWNQRVRGLSPYVPGEQPRDRRFIKLNTNENPYPPSPLAIEAVKRAAGDGLRLYPDPACTELREAIATRYGVRPEQVFAGNGSDEVLAFIFGAFFEGGAEGLPILFPDITYSFYPVYAKLWDIPFKTVALKDDFSIDPADYLVPSGGVIFPNPNAPTGRLLSPDSIRGIARYHGEAGRLLVMDEAYGAFALPSGSLVPFLDSHPNLLTVHTLSKVGGLAGLRVGFAIGNEELIEGLRRVQDSFNSYTLDRLAQAGAAAALGDAVYYEEITQRVIRTRERVAAALGTLGFEVIPSRANFLFVRFPGRGGEEAFSYYRERGILVRRFNQDRIGDFLRVSIGTDGDMDVFLEVSGEISRGEGVC
jgi:histidinol-phosphate aminotransferase